MISAQRREQLQTPSSHFPLPSTGHGIVCIDDREPAYGWTLFVDPIDAKNHWGRARSIWHSHLRRNRNLAGAGPKPGSSTNTSTSTSCSAA